jgi:hypothetical protein
VEQARKLNSPKRNLKLPHRGIEVGRESKYWAKRYFENKGEFLRGAFTYIENVRNRDSNSKLADKYIKFLFYFCKKFILSSKGEEKASLTSTITTSTNASGPFWEDVEIEKLRDKLIETRRSRNWKWEGLEMRVLAEKAHHLAAPLPIIIGQVCARIPWQMQALPM